MPKTLPNTLAPIKKISEQAKTKVRLAFMQTQHDKEMSLALDMVNEHPWLAKDRAPYNTKIFFNQWPLLHVAMHSGDEPLTNAMLDHGAPLEQWDAHRRTPLFLALEQGSRNNETRERLAWILIERGARCSALDASGRSLAYANEGNYSRKLFNHLVHNGAKLDCQLDGIGCVSKIIKNAYLQIGSTTMESMKKDALHKRKMQLEQCRWRIESGANVSFFGESLTAHCLAMPLIYGDLEMANFLVAHGADPRAKDAVGNNFLHALTLPSSVITWLTTHGVDLDAGNAWSETPIAFHLHDMKLANSKMNFAAVKALMIAGANLDAFDAQGADVGMTPRERIEAARDVPDLQQAYRALKARRTAMSLLEEIEHEVAPSTGRMIR